ncbi:MAG: DUF4013 domain-containing protein [Methanospirillum sp.]|uniref:DUF4013 domain-containing protein n=1 Tax=Methanospirillum sp. TaxID=45200 RepID=UPI00236A800D|nr:DUF4013 domain-containing protein [Methanospirillum sp.]MDD1727461.1 DUF4013 domain-containing protein [Methanospirillum sp.]
MDIIASIKESFGYATEGLVGKWGRWIVLIIGTIIFPLIMGYTLRVMKGITPAPETDNYGGMFIDGIKMLIIGIVYMIIPCIIGLIIFVMSGGLGALTMLGMDVGDPGAYIGLLIGTVGISFLAFFILAFIFGLFEIIGIMRFARSGSMGSAFEFSEIFAKIGSIGWVTYILAIIVLCVVMMVIQIILNVIPVIGWLLSLIVAPYLSIVGGRYYSLIYDAAD